MKITIPDMLEIVGLAGVAVGLWCIDWRVAVAVVGGILLAVGIRSNIHARARSRG